MRRTLFTLVVALGLSVPGLAQLSTGPITSSASTCPNSNNTSCVVLQLSQKIGQVALTVSGTFSATLQFEWSTDGGSTWVTLSSTPNGGGTAVTSTTATGVWIANVGGGSFVRVRCSAYTSGVASVTLNPSEAAGATSTSGGLPTGLNFSSPTLTVSSAGNGNGALALSGNTSGTATFTAPAVAGTNTNAVVSSNALAVPAGSGSTPTYAFSDQLTTGIAECFSQQPCIVITGSSRFRFNGTQAVADPIMSIGWSSVTNANGVMDTGSSRAAASVVAFGNGSSGDTTGKLKASGYISVGTKFTVDTGCGTIATSSGGGTAGKFTTVGSTSCTAVVTLGDTATAPNGWACYAHDLTTSADYNNPHVSSTGTTVTIVTGTIVSGDVIEFGCVGY